MIVLDIANLHVLTPQSRKPTRFVWKMNRLCATLSTKKNMEVSNNVTPQQQVEHNADSTLHPKRLSGTVTFGEPSTTVPITEQDSKSNITSQSIMNKSLFHSFFPIRILEKIPLIIKLALIIAFCLIPMAVFGALLINSAAVNLSHANEIKKLSKVTVHLSEIVNSLQNERGTTALYLGSHKRQYIIQLAKARNQTDIAIERFLALSVSPNDILINEKWKRTWYLFEDYLGKVTNYSKGIGEWRMKVEDVTNETFLPTFQFVSDWNSLTNDLIRVITSQSLDPTFAIIHNSFNLLTSTKEYRGIRRFLGTFGFLNGSLSQSSINSFKEAAIRVSNLLEEYFVIIENLTTLQKSVKSFFREDCLDTYFHFKHPTIFTKNSIQMFSVMISKMSVREWKTMSWQIIKI